MTGSPPTLSLGLGIPSVLYPRLCTSVIPRVWCYQVMSVSGVSGVGVAFFVLPADLVRLHARQMIWMLSGVSCPPLEYGVMWSASALAGVYGVV